jgi:hypothetical protein
LAWPASGQSIIEKGEATRLPRLDVYTPPVTLAAAADIYRRMTVPVGVAGGGTFPFVADTGANRSVVSEELAVKLGLARGSEEPLNGIAGVQMTPTAIADLAVGGRVELGVALSILPAAAIGGDGMLGLDRLEGRQLTLDFKGQALHIARAGRRLHDPAEIAVRARRRDGQLVLVDADIAGIPIIAFLDSGAQNTMGNRVLRSMAEARAPGARWVEAPIVSATGQSIPSEMAELPRLRIGGLRLPNWPVFFADLHMFRMWSLIDRPAIVVGVDILSRFQSVCLDFARDEVRFLPPQPSI